MLSRLIYLLSVTSLLAIFSLPALAADNNGESDEVLKVVYHADFADPTAFLPMTSSRIRLSSPT